MAIATSMVLFAVAAAITASQRPVRRQGRVSLAGLDGQPLRSPRVGPAPETVVLPAAAQTEVANEASPASPAAPAAMLGPAVTARQPAAWRPESPLRSAAETSALEAALTRSRLTVLATQLEGARRVAYTRTASIQQIYALAGEDLMVEMDVELGGVHVPFLVIGPTGVFAVLPTDLWRFEDLAHSEPIVEALRRLVGGRGIEPQVIFYNPFGAQAQRSWFDGRGRGAWVVGAGQLRSWLDAQPGPGLDPGEIAVLREAVKPRWDPPRAVIVPSPTLPRG